MRILLLVTNLAVGGAERSMLRYEAALSKAGHDVVLLLMDDRIALELRSGVRVEALSDGTLGNGVLGRMRLARRLRRWYRDTTRTRPFDLVISTLPFTDKIAVTAGLPSLWLRVANTLGEEIASLGPQTAKGRRRKARYTALYGRNRCIAVSEGVKADLVATFSADPAQIEVIRTPLDLDLLQRLADEPDPGLPPRPFLLYAGRFAPQKRLDLLLSTYVRSGVPLPLHLLTAPHPDLERLIQETGVGDRVRVEGLKGNPFPWLRAAKAVLLSSDREGMPNVLAEALALGTPVVATDCRSGPREILGTRLARWLSPPGDVEAFADRIRAVIADPPDVGPADVTAFSESVFVRQVENLVRRGKEPEAR